MLAVLGVMNSVSPICRLVRPAATSASTGPMADEPAAPTPLDALNLESLSDEELQRLTQLLMSERERRMGLEPGPEDPL